jgi:hypothetical protein
VQLSKGIAKIPPNMKTVLDRFVPVLFFCAFAAFSRAGDFQTVVIAGGASLTQPINVPDDRFLVIRNFTQEGTATNRGTVTVTNLNGQPVTMNGDILTAAIIDPSATTIPPGLLEVINNVVVAGPATVTASCPTGATCFITYRKGED